MHDMAGVVPPMPPPKPPPNPPLAEPKVAEPVELLLHEAMATAIAAAARPPAADAAARCICAFLPGTSYTPHALVSFVMRMGANARRIAAATAIAGAAAATSCNAPFHEGPGLADDAGSTGPFDASGTFTVSPPPSVPPPVPVSCSTSASCQPGQVCCGSGMFTSACQAPPCPTTPAGPLQLCAISAECLIPGDVCAPPSGSTPQSMLVMGLAVSKVMLCSAPDGGSDAAGDAATSVAYDAADGGGEGEGEATDAPVEGADDGSTLGD